MDFINENNYESILRTIEKLMDISPEVSRDSDEGILLDLLASLIENYENRKIKEYYHNLSKEELDKLFIEFQEWDNTLLDGLEK